MRPLPGGHTRKLQDILVDAKVPRHLRDSLPLVFADGAKAAFQSRIRKAGG